MNLYLVRHGQTDWNTQRIIQGQTDIPLNATGIAEAEKLKPKIDKLPIEVCVSSPLRRARKTAEIIVDGRCKIIETDLLKERGFGDFQGKSTSVYRVNYWDPTLDLSDHNVESMRELLVRARKFLDWVQELGYENVLVVSHGDFLKAVHYSLVGYNEKTDFFDWHMRNCEVEKVILPLK